MYLLIVTYSSVSPSASTLLRTVTAGHLCISYVSFRLQSDPQHWVHDELSFPTGHRPASPSPSAHTRHAHVPPIYARSLALGILQLCFRALSLFRVPRSFVLVARLLSLVFRVLQVPVVIGVQPGCHLASSRPRTFPRLSTLRAAESANSTEEEGLNS